MLLVSVPSPNSLAPRQAYRGSLGGIFIGRSTTVLCRVAEGGSSSPNFRPRLGRYAEAITTPPAQSGTPPASRVIREGRNCLAHITGSVAKPDEEDWRSQVHAAVAWTCLRSGREGKRKGNLWPEQTRRVEIAQRR